MELFVSLPDILGDENGKSLGQHLYRPEHKPVDPVRGSKGRQGVKAYALAHDDRIRDHIELLPQVA